MRQCGKGSRRRETASDEEREKESQLRIAGKQSPRSAAVASASTACSSILCSTTQLLGKCARLAYKRYEISLSLVPVRLLSLSARGLGRVVERSNCTCTRARLERPLAATTLNTSQPVPELTRPAPTRALCFPYRLEPVYAVRNSYPHAPPVSHLGRSTQHRPRADLLSLESDPALPNRTRTRETL